MSLIPLLTLVWGPGAEPLVVGRGGVVGGGNRNPPPLSPRGPGGGVTPRLGPGGAAPRIGDKRDPPLKKKLGSLKTICPLG
jgi:hypothetical protein